MTETGKPERRFQFSLRRVLLWMLVVALAFSMLSPLGFDGGVWLIPFGWFVMVLGLRWSFGSRVAATASVIAAMLLVPWYCCAVWSASDRTLDFAALADIAVVAGFFGGFLGLVPFVIVEAACRTIDWVDRIGQGVGA